MPDVKLRAIETGDLDAFFQHQLDADAIHTAAFTAADPTDKQSFHAHWDRIMADDSIIKRTIVFGEHAVGHVIRFDRDGTPEITYWLDRACWGKGIATRALTLFLDEFTERPIFARAAADNIASVRVLEKCSFELIATERGFANARGHEIDEVVMELRDRAD